MPSTLLINPNQPLDHGFISKWFSLLCVFLVYVAAFCHGMHVLRAYNIILLYRKESNLLRAAEGSKMQEVEEEAEQLTCESKVSEIEGIYSLLLRILLRPVIDPPLQTN